MIDPTLIIHAGFHKSGTTALQMSFHTNAKQLLQLGINYPKLGSKAHHRIAWALTQRTWGWKARGGSKIPPKYWNRKARLISRAKEKTVLLSSEFFSEMNQEQIEKLRSDVKGREFRILFTLRPMAKLLPSTYQQYLKYGLATDFEEWLSQILDKPGESSVTPSFWVRHEHAKVISRWADAFGAERITVLVVNEAEPKFLFQEVNKYLGLSEDTLQAEQSESNRSLSAEEVALLLELNRKFPKERSWNEYEVFIRRGYVRQLTHFVPATPGKAPLLTPEWAVDRANEIGRQTAADIRQMGVNIIGDLDSLGNASVPSGKTIYPESIDIKVVADAMLAFDRNTLEVFPLDWVQRDIFRRYKNRLKQEVRRFI